MFLGGTGTEMAMTSARVLFVYFLLLLLLLTRTTTTECRSMGCRTQSVLFSSKSTRSCIRTKSSQIHTYTHVYTLLSSSKSATQSHSITTTSAPLHCCNCLRGCPHIISSLLLPLQLLLEKTQMTTTNRLITTYPH